MNLVSSAMGTPIATPVPPDGGRPADSSAVDAVTQTIQKYVSCINSGDAPRLTALYTDPYFQRLFGGFDERAIAEIAATPIPLPEDYVAALQSVENIQALDYARASAVVVISGERSPMVLEKSEDGFLIDHIIELPEEGAPAP